MREQLCFNDIAGIVVPRREMIDDCKSSRWGMVEMVDNDVCALVIITQRRKNKAAKSINRIKS